MKDQVGYGSRGVGQLQQRCGVWTAGGNCQLNFMVIAKKDLQFAIYVF
jgi:hypothetical protein